MDNSYGRMPTITDVAKAAKLSTATVSHVLNETRFVSEESRNRVYKAIEELGYYPNHLVGGLRKKRSYTVGLVLPCISNETLGGLAEHLQRNLFPYKENLIICNTSYDIDLEDREICDLIMKRVDAIVSIPTSDSPVRLLEAQRQGIPVILVDRLMEQLGADAIVVDNYSATVDAVKYLYSLGHRNIGYIDRKKSQSHSNEQRRGYCNALKELGIEQTYVITADGYDYAAGRSAAIKLLELQPKITACLAYYDVIAFGAIRGFHECGRKTPEDISVIGYDCMPFSRYACPTITSVEFPVEAIARKVCKVTMSRIKEKDVHNQIYAPAQTIVITPKFVIGESTKECKELGFL